MGRNVRDEKPKSVCDLCQRAMRGGLWCAPCTRSFTMLKETSSGRPCPELVASWGADRARAGMKASKKTAGAARGMR
jgi:hypothetical protein